jgi:hypothetical protein
MAGRDARRLVAGRHTLGSPLESVEPIDRPSVPALPAIMPAIEDLTDGGEPFHTIYVATWHAARERAPAAGRVLVDLMDRVEAAWPAVRDLQRWFEANQTRARERDAYGHLLAFIGADVVDMFREVAGGVTDLVPGGDRWEAEADPDDVAGDVDTFVRYLALLHYAAGTAPVPEPFAVLVSSVAERLRGWSDEVVPLVTACAGDA